MNGFRSFLYRLVKLLAYSAVRIGVERETLRVYRHIAGAYEFDIRLSNLSWTHHEHVSSRSDRHHGSRLPQSKAGDNLEAPGNAPGRP